MFIRAALDPAEAVEPVVTDYAPSCPEKKTRRYLPTWTSSPSLSWTVSMRSRLT
jgi:hypothetical protein